MYKPHLISSGPWLHWLTSDVVVQSETYWQLIVAASDYATGLLPVNLTLNYIVDAIGIYVDLLFIWLAIK